MCTPYIWVYCTWSFVVHLSTQPAWPWIIIWCETLWPIFKDLFRHLPGGAKENYWKEDSQRPGRYSYPSSANHKPYRLSHLARRVCVGSWSEYKCSLSFKIISRCWGWLFLTKYVIKAKKKKKIAHVRRDCVLNSTYALNSMTRTVPLWISTGFMSRIISELYCKHEVNGSQHCFWTIGKTHNRWRLCHKGTSNCALRNQLYDVDISD